MSSSASINFLCPTPKDKCNGQVVMATNGMGKTVNAHSSSKECQSCYIRYLISQGYKQIGPRELVTPDNTILVLNKQSKFGMPLRPGKRGDKVGGSSKRFVVKQRGKQGGTSGGITVI